MRTKIRFGRKNTSVNTLLYCAVMASLLSQEPPAAYAEEATVSLSTLEEKIPSALQIQAADAQVEYTRHLVHQEESKEGLQLFGGVDAGRHRDVVTETVTRNYSSAVPKIGISYPLLGGRAQLLESSQNARTQLQLNSIDLEVDRLQLLWELRKNYILYWQYQLEQQLTEKHVAELSDREAAARRLVNRGLWTQSDYLQFTSDLATARNDLNQFITAQRDALNGMRTVVGENLPGFLSIQPELPQACTNPADLYKSAENHSGDLKKLQAQLDNIKYDQNLTTGRSITSDVHLMAVYSNEFTTAKYGYAAIVGAQVNMPLHFMEADDANADKLNAATIQNGVLVDQARSTLHLKVQDALEDYQQAQQKVDATTAAEKAADEGLRESKLRFENVPQPLFGELVQKIISEYHTSLADVEARSNVALRANDMLLLAPDKCATTH